MKNIQVNANQVALVLKNRAFKRLLGEGSYWLWGNEEVFIYEKGNAFASPVELSVLLQHAEIVEALEVVEVKDNEMMVQFEDNRFKTVFAPGKYAFWCGIKNYTYTAIDLNKIEITEDFSLHLITTKLLPYVRSYTVEAYEKGVLIVDGKFVRVLDGGTYYWWKNTINIQVA